MSDWLLLSIGMLGILLGGLAIVLWLQGTPRRLVAAQDDLGAELSTLKRNFHDLAGECGALETAVERRLEEMEGLKQSIETKRRRAASLVQQQEQQQERENDTGSELEWIRRARASGFPNA